MVTIRLVLAACCVALLAGPAAARDMFDDVKLEVIPETHGIDPYPNEMILVRIRGVYRPLINIQHLEQPSLTDFGWMHLTRDTAFEAEWGGFSASGYERVIAVFPEKSGPLTIGSFTHKLSVVDGAGYRDLAVKSAPVTVNVAKWEGPGGPSDPNVWWLPARQVKIIDEWSGDPNRVPRGETIRRTVTIEAYGVTAEQLPPPPLMRSAGIISFRGPTDRETRVTAEGPVSRATYRWDMRPTSAFPATVEPIKIPWFDTVARTMKDAVIPAQRMAWAIAGAPGDEARAKAAAARPTWAVTLAAGVAAFLAGVAILLVGAGGLDGLPTLPPRAFWRLRAAAWRGDAASVRAAITELVRAEPERSALWSGRSEIRSAIAELDRHLYHPGAAPSPNLRALSRAILAARRRAGVGRREARSGLAPLDGPYKRG